MKLISFINTKGYIYLLLKLMQFCNNYQWHNHTLYKTDQMDIVAEISRIITGSGIYLQRSNNAPRVYL